MAIEYNKLGEIIRKYKSSNKRLAAHLEIDHNTVSRWSNNVHQPSLPDVYRIAEYFNIQASDILVPVELSDGPSQAQIDNGAAKKKVAIKKVARKTGKKK